MKIEEQELKIIDGRFFQGDQPVRPSIGNVEQIYLLRRWRRAQEARMLRPRVVDTGAGAWIVTALHFPCPWCGKGQSISLPGVFTSRRAALDAFAFGCGCTRDHCKECGEKYHISPTGYGGWWRILPERVFISPKGSVRCGVKDKEFEAL